MSSAIQKLFFIFLILTGSQGASAQQACGTNGETVGPAAEFGNTTYAIGDLTIVRSGADPSNVNDADWYFGPGAYVDVYASITIPSGAVVRLKAGAVLNVYGDFVNNGYLFIEPGATINFYGNTWTNTPAAVVGDGVTTVNSMAGGSVNFISPRATVPPGVSATSCVNTNYSGGSFTQQIDGGNVPMDIALHVQNINNIQLVNSAVKIEGNVSMDVDNGDVLLNGQDFIFTSNGSISGYRPERMVVTSNAITGHMVKQNYTGVFTFPVGIYEGDYTPASVNNTNSNTIHVSVQDYAASASMEAGDNGMNRTWNIYADNASGNSNLDLQHNSSTNQASFNNSLHFVTRWSNTTPNTTGQTTTSLSAWQSNFMGSGTSTGSLTTGSPVTSASERSLAYSNFATAPGTPEAYFSKSSNQFAVLPVALISFNGNAAGCNTAFSWQSGVESGAVLYTLEHSTDGISFTEAKKLAGTGSNSSYSCQYSPQNNGAGYYRLKMNSSTEFYQYSNTIVINTKCDAVNTQWFVYPSIIQTGAAVNVQLQTQDPALSKASLVVTSITGQRAFVYEVQVHQGQNKYILPDKKLVPGTYLLCIYDKNLLRIGDVQKLVYTR